MKRFRKLLAFLLVLVVATVGVLIFNGCSDSDGVPKIEIPEGFILVPSGSFERDGYTITLTNDFYMGKYEVTNAQYCDMLNYANGQGYLTVTSSSVKNSSGNSQELLNMDDIYCEISYSGGTFVLDSGKDNHPAIEVTWYGSAFFCNMISEQEGLTKLYDLSDWSCDVYGATGYRLPTEAEWHYTAQYNDGRTYPWGDASPTSSHANYYDNNVGWTTDVGSYPTGNSQLGGLCDMAGNVWEWCNDWYASYPSSDVSDPTGPSSSQSYRVLRGGSWNLNW